VQVERYNVLIMEDNDAVASRIERVMKEWYLSKTVSVCGTVKSAAELVKSTKVDILLADLRLPDGSGVEIIKLLATTNDQSLTLVISALTDQSAVMDALQAGAVGYLLKDDPKMQILQAIEAVLAGHSPISPAIARHLVRNLMPKKPIDKSETQISLTPREVEVLGLIAKGFTNNEVSRLLNISTQTVPVHVRNIYFKLQAKNRSEAAYEAVRLGILDGR